MTEIALPAGWWFWWALGLAHGIIVCHYLPLLVEHTIRAWHRRH